MGLIVCVCVCVCVSRHIQILDLPLECNDTFLYTVITYNFPSNVNILTNKMGIEIGVNI